MQRCITILIYCMLVSACNPLEETTLPNPRPTTTTLSEKVPYQPQKQDDLSGIKQTLSQHMQEIEDQHAVKILLIGTGEDHILIGVRSSTDVERTLSEAEKEALKKTLFELAGTEFPVKLSVRDCCTKAVDITGKIKSYDKSSNRILIVNEQKKIGKSEDPEATWVSLADDGVLNVSGSRVYSGFDLAIVGREAKVWTTGLIAKSNPSKTSAVKVVVE